MSVARAPRLFFALWPDDGVRAALARLAERACPRESRRVRPENLHVTLVFLGATTSDQRPCVEGVAGEVQVAPFGLALDRLGWWRRPQVLWAGCSTTPQPLHDLVTGLRSGCARCGFDAEERPFEVHATLARRVRQGSPAVPFDPIAWAVDRFSLVESHLSPGGSEYRVLRSWRLVGGGADAYRPATASAAGVVGAQPDRSPGRGGVAGDASVG